MTFGPTKAQALTDEQREIVRARFGSSVLPPDTIVEQTDRYLVVEHLNLDRFLDLNPKLNLSIELCADGKLYFPRDSRDDQQAIVDAYGDLTKQAHPMCRCVKRGKDS